MPDTMLRAESLLFSGTTLRRNSSQAEAVRAVQARLNERGCGPLAEDGLFGVATEAAVRLFQSRFFDASGVPLTVDGRVGPVTWAALFGTASLPPLVVGSGLAEAALRVAAEQLGIAEDPPGSNRGAAVEEFLDAVDLGPGNAWCAAFVYWCADRAARETGLPNRLPRTGGVLDMWRRARRAGLPCITAAEAAAQPALVTSGMVFVMDHGAGRGHTGFVRSLANGRLCTIEGNSNDGGSREGTGVFELTRRTLGSVSTGFIGLP